MYNRKLLITGLTLLTLTACSIQTIPATSPTLSESPTPMAYDGQRQDQERAKILKDWNEHRNANIGFSIYLPQDWHAADETASGIRFENTDGTQKISISPIHRGTLEEIAGKTFYDEMHWYNGSMWNAGESLYGALESVSNVADNARYRHYALIRAKRGVTPMRADEDEPLDYVTVDVMGTATQRQAELWNQAGAHENDLILQSTAEKIIQTFRFL